MAAFDILKNLLTSVDMFSRKIYFSYKGKPSYKTLLGGIVTLVIFILMATYSYSLFNEMLSRNKITANKNSLRQPIVPGVNPVDLGASKIRIAVFWTDSSLQPMDERYGRIIFGNATSSTDPGGDEKYEFSEIKSGPCSPEDFPLASETNLMKTNPFVCADLSGVVLDGDVYSALLKYLRIDFLR